MRSTFSLFASRSETQGMVLTEAMAAGKPVVALDGRIDVVEDKVNGRFVAAAATRRRLCKPGVDCVSFPRQQMALDGTVRDGRAIFDAYARPAACGCTNCCCRRPRRWKNRWPPQRPGPPPDRSRMDPLEQPGSRGDMRTRARRGTPGDGPVVIVIGYYCASPPVRLP